MIHSDDDVVFKCLEVEQPIGTFYIGSIPAKDVLDIAKADIRRIEARDFERLVGIQRELRPKRVREIKQYVNNIDATFPTAIILAAENEFAEYSRKNNTMRISRIEGAAQILDGQHRIAGLEGFAGKFNLNVTIFIDMDLQDRAMTFATINLAQTKVNKSLVYDLYEFQEARSPQKTCHQIARLLNREEGSPLRHRIKILGTATGEDLQYLTQATVVQSLIPYITDDENRDRDALRRGKPLPPVAEGKLSQVIFRKLFEQDRDHEIAKIIWNLFVCVSNRWPNAWGASEQGRMLNRTSGFTAIMRFLHPLYTSKGGDGKLSTKSISNTLNKIRLSDHDFNTDNYKPGSTGANALYRDLLEQSGLGA